MDEFTGLRPSTWELNMTELRVQAGRTAPGALALIVLGLWSTAAGAVDGVLEINAACAASGCFAGDAAGLPVTLTAPGSYRLTSSLILPDADTTGIYVQADDVSIDLNGFSITGPTRCEGDPSAAARVCSNLPAVPENPGAGIKAIDFAAPLNAWHRTRVVNGTVWGTGGVGLYLGDQSVVADLTVGHATALAILAGQGSAVRNAVATQSGSGITVGHNSVVEGSRSSFNGGTGIATGDASTVRASTAMDNGGSGIDVAYGSTLSHSSALGNGGDGIIGRGANAIHDNSSRTNSGIGISCSNGCIVIGNTAVANTSFGFSGAASSAIEDNVFYQNNGGGLQLSGGIELGENVCGSDVNCP